MATPEILIVEDEAIVAMDIAGCLKSMGYGISGIAPSGAAALENATARRPDLALVDIKLRGEMDGTEVARQIRDLLDVPVVYLTAYADAETIDRAKVAEPFGYLVKPFDPRSLAATVELALYKHRMESELRKLEGWLAATLRSVGDAVIATDSDGVVTFMNPVAEALTGWKSGEAVNKRLDEVMELVDEDGRAPDEGLVSRALRHGAIIELEEGTALVCRDGNRIPISDSAAPIRDEKGVVGGVVIVFRDMRESVRREAETKKTLSLLGATLESTADGLVVVDRDGRVVSFNRKWVEMWNIPEGLIGSRDEGRLVSFAAELLEAPEGFFAKAREIQARPDAERHDVLELKDGRIFERLSRPQRIDGATVGTVWSFRDVTERRQAERQVEHLAFHDALTGLPNRRLFSDRMAVALARAQRHKRSLTVLFLDLDHFKRVNDTLGHTAGDELLKAVAERLKGCIRNDDTLARLGGDEFTVLLSEVGGAPEAVQIAEKLLRVIAAPLTLQGQELYLSASIGLAFFPEDGGDIETLLKNADSAMYRAKELGRNTYHLCTPDLNTLARERLSLENSLHRGLERQEFVLYYQPQLDLATGRIVGLEALLRWNHPERGLLQPVDFISAAEESRLILPIGEWVLRAACRQARSWQESGMSSIRVAVNLSARQFLQQENLPAMVSNVLRETGLEPRWLALEITESTAMQDMETSVRLLRDLREMGIEIALDDFGTGFSSLTYLRRFPVNAIKLDYAFIRGVAEDPADAAIASAVIAMAHSLRLRVIAEGVETEPQLAFLREHECDEVQGYLVCRPIPANGVDAFLRDPSTSVTASPDGVRQT